MGSQLQDRFFKFLVAILDVSQNFLASKFCWIKLLRVLLPSINSISNV